VYLYFPDRDALVAAAMQRCHTEMLQAADEADAEHQDPALGLRARILAQAAWVQEHPGIYKVMHESKVGMPFKEVLFTRTTAAASSRSRPSRPACSSARSANYRPYRSIRCSRPRGWVLPGHRERSTGEDQGA
jgi:AcrR family transcriptional regulator